MCKILSLLTIILIFSFILFSYAIPEDKDRIKSSLIKQIVQKVSNLTLKAFANMPREEKSWHLHKIQQKLQHSAQAFGSSSDKYVRLVMKGVRLKGFDTNNDQTKTNSNANNDTVPIDSSENISVSTNDVHDDDDTEPINSSENISVTNNEHDDKAEVTDNNNNVDETTIKNASDEGSISPNMRALVNENGEEPPQDESEDQPDNESRNGLDIEPDSKKISIWRTNHTFKNESKTTPRALKEKLINNIASKIETLAKNYLRSAQTKEARQKVIKILKRQLERTAARKYSQLRNKQEGIKTYVDLIGKGLKVILQRNARKPTRRMEIQFTKDITIKKDLNEENSYSSQPTTHDGLLNNDLGYGSILEDVKNPKSILKLDDDLKLKSKHVTFKLDHNTDANFTSACDNNVKDICNKIELLNSFTCEKDNTILHISKMCDGITDCLDNSDELNCARQAIDSIRHADQVMSHIDTSLSSDCYPALFNNGLLSKKNGVLRKVLHKQLDFIQEHTIADPETFSKRGYNADTPALKNTVQEVINVVGMLSSALEAAICSNKLQEGTRKQFQLSKEFEAALNNTTRSPILLSCDCNGEKCAEACSIDCESICYQKYSLGRWQCEAVSGERSVHIDMICDGKLDCYDETDEKNCFEERSLSKYEAIEMYNYILQMILTKTIMKQYDQYRNSLVSLHGLVSQLQKLTLTRSPDVLEVKRLRDKCFAKMSSLYNSALSHASKPEDTAEIYVFLLSLNEKLVSAMKRSQIGNDRIIAANNCVCKGYSCALVNCPKPCKRACSAAPKLTRYLCAGSSNINHSLSVEAVCNGKRDCPRGDDEENCQQEVCRSHHLKLLRTNLHNVGEKYKGTSLGEALSSWKKKVMASLLYVENSNRPTLSVIQYLVNSILHDLVMAYGTIEDYRRNTNKAFDEFQKWSRVVLDVVRSCGH